MTMIAMHAAPTLAAVVMLALLTGCGSDSAAPPKPPERPFATFPDLNPDDGFFEAEQRGALVEDAGCLYVMEGDRRYLPAFQESHASWDAEAHELTVDGQTFQDGDQVTLGGAQETVPGLVLPDTCEDVPVFLANTIDPGTDR